MKIGNGKNVLLNAQSGTVPDMSGALQGWMQKMVFTTIVKTINELSQLVETPTTFAFEGVWQPMSAQAISMKPEGQRAWKWFQAHSTIALPLQPDDLVTYLGQQYRVKAVNLYNLYGYYNYELTEDINGSVP